MIQEETEDRIGGVPPPPKQEKTAARRRRYDPEEVSFDQLLLQPTIWFLCGQQICRAAGYAFFASWFPTFLQETRNVSIEKSGYLQAMVLAGTLLGGLLGGGVADWVWRKSRSLHLSRGGVGASSLFACSLLVAAAWFVESSLLAMGLLTFGALLAALAGPCAYAAAIDLGGSRTPQVFGLMNMSGNLAAAAGPILLGMFFAWSDNWNSVLLLFAGIYLAGAFCWCFVRSETQASEM